MDQTYCMKCMQPNEGTNMCPHCGYVAGETPLASHVLKPGTILDGRYLLGEPLGQGGFGITYIARDLNLDIRVAVKEYYPSGYAVRNVETSERITITDDRLRLDIQKGKDSFLKEARTLARFQGTPGIVNALNFFEANDTAYIVMEYLEGETLGSRTKRHLFTADEIFQLMDPIFGTLDTIHQKGVVHRDISPDNIMMLSDGSLKLMDFGAARLMNYGDQHSVSVVLKAGYAPKEQYTSKGQQGPWTDIYALCATIYKCITGITPDDALDRVDGDDLKWPSELGFPISVQQEAVLKKGMAVFQKDRFQSIGELKAALRAETISSTEENGPITLEPKSSDDKTVALPRKQPKSSAEKKPAKEPQKEPEAKPQQESKQSREKPAQKEKTTSKKRIAPYLWIGGAVLGLIVLSLVLIALLGGKQKKGAAGTLASAETATVPETPLPTLKATDTVESMATPAPTAAPEPTYTPAITPAETPNASEVGIDSVKVGDVYPFGAYEQDADATNGKEPINWIVLAKADSKILVISQYALDCQPYNASYSSVTWEACTLRKWLNETFLNAAFSEDEQKRIVAVPITAQEDPSFSETSESEATDKVFLLSVAIANQYFRSDETRKCLPTKYAVAQQAYLSSNHTSEGKATCWWWLRSPGERADSAACIDDDGSVSQKGYSVNYTYNAVRPVLWIDLGSGDTPTPTASPTAKPTSMPTQNPVAATAQPAASTPRPATPKPATPTPQPATPTPNPATPTPTQTAMPDYSPTPMIQSWHSYRYYLVANYDESAAMADATAYWNGYVGRGEWISYTVTEIRKITQSWNDLIWPAEYFDSKLSEYERIGYDVSYTEYGEGYYSFSYKSDSWMVSAIGYYYEGQWSH